MSSMRTALVAGSLDGSSLHRLLLRSRETHPCRRYFLAAAKTNWQQQQKQQQQQRWSTATTTASSLTPSLDRESANVLIIGGGPVGSSTAFHLAKMQGDCGKGIVVVERDFSMGKSSALFSAGGIRQQFSVKENVLMSLYGRDFLLNSSEWLDSNDENGIHFQQHGYLFLASTENERQSLLQNHKVQREAGCTDICLLNPDQLKAQFPWLNVQDIVLGSFGQRGEGWFDPWSLVSLLKKKNVDMGVTYVQGQAVQATRSVDNGKVETVQIESATAEGSTTTQHYNVGHVVNAAGALAGPVLELLAAGRPHSELPVKPRKRCVFFFRCPSRPPPTHHHHGDDNGEKEWQQSIPGPTSPLTIDPTSMVYFRPEGTNLGHFLAGVSPPAHEDVDCFPSPESEDLTVQHDLFENVIWPALHHRVASPAFEGLKCVSSWAGLYEVNVVDHNAIIDFHPDLPNVLLLNGFSGHGLQHSPAAGRAGAELLLRGRFETLDLTLFNYPRLLPHLNGGGGGGGGTICEEGIV